MDLRKRPEILDLTALYNVAEEIIERYKLELETQDIKGSGALIDSIKWNIIEKDSNTLILEMQLLDYWYYTEYGRQPTSSQSTVWDNPVEDISNWLISKKTRGKLIPRADKPIPTTETEIKKVAYAIVQKIHKYGYYGRNSQGKHSLQNTLNQCKADGTIERFCYALCGAYAEEIKTELNSLKIRKIPKQTRPKNL